MHRKVNDPRSYFDYFIFVLSCDVQLKILLRDIIIFQQQRPTQERENRIDDKKFLIIVLIYLLFFIISFSSKRNLMNGCNNFIMLINLHIYTRCYTASSDTHTTLMPFFRWEGAETHHHVRSLMFHSWYRRNNPENFCFFFSYFSFRAIHS